MHRWFMLSLAASLWIQTPALATAAESDDRARTIAENVTTKGAEIFDTLDAPAIAATYHEKAVLVFLKAEGGEFSPAVHRGRREIESFYQDIFKNPETIKSRNVVERAKFISPEVLAIDGTFHLNTLKPDSPKIAFHQIRQEKQGKWQILSMEILPSSD